MNAHTISLPPNTRMRNGVLMRSVRVNEDGVSRLTRRPVALTLKDAQESGADFYSHEFGWIRGGLKMEREHPLVDAGLLKEVFDDDDDDEDDDSDPE